MISLGVHCCCYFHGLQKKLNNGAVYALIGCSSTGGHYNPFGVVHGARQDKIRHVGDLGNLMADSQGKIDVTFKDEMAGLVGQYSIAGRAFVVSGYHNTSQLIFLIFNRNFTET